MKLTLVCILRTRELKYFTSVVSNMKSLVRKGAQGAWWDCNPDANSGRIFQICLKSCIHILIKHGRGILYSVARFHFEIIYRKSVYKGHSSMAISLQFCNLHINRWIKICTSCADITIRERHLYTVLQWLLISQRIENQQPALWQNFIQ